MCHCITPQALLQGLVRRVDHDGYEPTEADLRALAGAGCGASELRAMVAQLVPGPATERLDEALDAAFPTDGYRRG